MAGIANARGEWEGGPPWPTLAAAAERYLAAVRTSTVRLRITIGYAAAAAVGYAVYVATDAPVPEVVVICIVVGMFVLVAYVNAALQRGARALAALDAELPTGSAPMPVCVGQTEWVRFARSIVAQAPTGDRQEL